MSYYEFASDSGTGFGVIDAGGIWDDLSEINGAVA